MYISIDLGGTNTRIVGSASIEEPAFISQPVRYKNTQIYENDLRAMIDAVKQVSNGQKLDAIGLSTPGTPNEEKTQITSAKNIPQWNNKPLVVPISESFACPVFYDNDAVAAGLGEAYYGNQVAGDFHCIVWGTGIGGASISRLENSDTLDARKLLWKAHFADWEAACSGASLTKRFNAPPESFDEARWRVINDDFHQHLLRYIDTFQPQAIVFVGGLAVKNAELLQGIGTIHGTTIKVTQFGNDSGLMGGFGLIRQGLAFTRPG